jgi:hypothetical protein
MKHFPGALSDDKVEETFNSFSVKFNTPFVFLDPSGEELFSVAQEGADQPHTAASLQHTKVPAVLDRYLCDVIGSLAVPHDLPGDREIAASAVFCLETVLRLEADLEDLSSEIVRLYEELTITYSLSRKLGNEMDVDTICRQQMPGKSWKNPPEDGSTPKSSRYSDVCCMKAKSYRTDGMKQAVF